MKQLDKIRMAKLFHTADFSVEKRDIDLGVLENVYRYTGQCGDIERQFDLLKVSFNQGGQHLIVRYEVLINRVAGLQVLLHDQALRDKPGSKIAKRN